MTKKRAYGISVFWLRNGAIVCGPLRGWPQVVVDCIRRGDIRLVVRGQFSATTLANARRSAIARAKRAIDENEMIPVE